MQHAEALQWNREEDQRKRMKINFSMEIALSSYRYTVGGPRVIVIKVTIRAQNRSYRMR